MLENEKIHFKYTQASAQWKVMNEFSSYEEKYMDRKKNFGG